MKRYMIATLFLVGLVIVAGSAFGEKEHPGQGKEHPGAAKADMPRKAPKAHIAMLTEKLGLSEEQAAKVKDIFKAHRQAAQAQREAAKARREALQKDLAGVLNEEQMAKFNKFKKMRKASGKSRGGKFQRCRGGMFAGLDLTEEQKTKMAEICKEAHEKTMAVLTDQQREKLLQCKQKWNKTGGWHKGKGMGPCCPMMMDGKATDPRTSSD